MNLTRRQQPGSVLRELQQELFPLMSWFESPAQFAAEDFWMPKVDIKEEANEFVVYADMPGVKAEDVDIQMEGNTLTVKGLRKTEKEEKSKNFYRSECTSGKFYRQFTLPETVESDKIQARMKHGVLILHLPKSNGGNKQRKITVESEG